MKYRRFVSFWAILLALLSICSCSRNPKPENATLAVLRAFETHDIVMLGDLHGNKQEHAWLGLLVSSPEFAERVDDIVMEVGNSHYQESIDRYVSGENIPLEQVEMAWLNVAGMIGPPSPVYASLYRTVREINLKQKGGHQIRIVAGDPDIDWDRVTGPDQIVPKLDHRDEWYTQVVKDEVLAKHRKALLIMGAWHFLRGFPSGHFSIEQQLRLAGAKPYVIVFGTNTVGGYDDLDHRLDSWPAPAIVSLVGNWVGELPTLPVINGGIVDTPRYASGAQAPPPPAPAAKLKDAADAMLYLGPRDTLTSLSMTRAELIGTPYGKEIERRVTIQGFANFLSELMPEKAESPQFSRP